MEPDEKKHLIPAGTPMCQVIPFKREEWKSEYTWMEKEPLDKQLVERESVQANRVDWYKREAHHRKKYV
jgi:hypothetical protein